MQMKYLFTVKNIKFYYAGNGFLYKGLWTWNGKTNKRIVAFNNFKNWTGKTQ